MESLCNTLLARAGFTDDQDGDVCGTQSIDGLAQGFHRNGFSDKATKAGM